MRFLLGGPEQAWSSRRGRVGGGWDWAAGAGLLVLSRDLSFSLALDSSQRMEEGDSSDLLWGPKGPP